MQRLWPPPYAVWILNHVSLMHAVFRVPSLALLMIFAAGAASAIAQTCTQADVAAVVEDMSKRLRAANGESQPRLQARMRELAKLRGWSEIEIEDKALDLLEDDETRAQDEHASHLLGQIDQLGQTASSAPTCAQVAELKMTANQLIEVTGVKSAHISARLDAELKKAKGEAVAQAPKPAQPASPPMPAVPPKQQAAAAGTGPTPVPLARPPARPAWETQPAVLAPPQTAPPAADVLPGTPYQAPPAPVPSPTGAAALEFSQEDIRAAGSGVFGTISAELAAIIEYAFKSYGRPTGYILGSEGGAALLAGLRYGDGTLVTKTGGERKIYWQGPTVGYDLGLTGSRTMILIYNLRDPEQMFQSFGGIDGSAYLVGGVGLTVMKKGPIILAPIRTGLGLRLGANIGYLRFTPRPRFNPL